MLAQRLIVAVIIIPALVFLAALGGWVLAVALAAVLGYGAWEYWRLFSTGEYHPSPFFLVAGTAGIVLLRHAFSFKGSDLFLSLLLLAVMAWQMLQFEKGSQTAAVDFGITVGGILYLCWLGAYLASRPARWTVVASHRHPCHCHKRRQRLYHRQPFRQAQNQPARQPK